MTRTQPAPSSPSDEGVFVTVCTGHRCGALLSGPAGEGLGALRQAVAASSRTVLISTGCLGGCAAGPVMAVSTGTCRSGQVQATGTCWLGPMQAPLTRVLAGWLRAGGPPATPLPDELAEVRLRATAVQDDRAQDDRAQA